MIGIPPQFVRPLLAVALVVALLGLWRCSVDRAVGTREAAQRAANAEQARKADEGAAEQQRADDARIRAERNQLGKV